MEKNNSLLSKELDLSFITDNLENILAKVLAIVAVSFPGIELICTLAGYPHKLMQTQLRTIGYVGMTFLLIVFLSKKTHRFVMSDLLVLCMAVCSILSVVFSFDIDSAIAGCAVGYGEDIGQFVGYYIIFLMATHIYQDKYRKLILISILMAAALHTVPAWMQHFKIWPVKTLFTEFETAAYGLTQHYNFYGALAVIFSALSAMIFLMKNNKKYILWYVISIICFMAALFSNSRLTWVGLAGYMLFVLIVEIYFRNKNIESVLSGKRIWVMILSFVIVCIFVALFDGAVASQISETAGEIEGDYSGSLGTGRLEIWTVGLYGVKDNLLTGLGLDNYYYAYELYPYEIQWRPAIKGHNEYIHTLVTQGVPALISYLALCCYVIFFSLKVMIYDNDKIRKSMTYILVAMAVGYFCQAMFNSSVTNIAVYKWLIMGLLLPRSSQKVIKIFEKRVKDGEQKA